jgi:LPS export ABC transporter permease LptF/LPS export ABC transporter permease LptG
VSILDRYVIRQVLTPFAFALLVFTFVVIIPGLRDYAERFIAKGAPADVVVSALLTLIPSALALSIPMSLLLGLLVAFGRLSGDREFVALQACGVSLGRLLRPVTIIAVLATMATAYMWMVGMPAGNVRFREIAFQVTASLAEGEVRPRIFFEQFPGLTIFVRDVPLDGGWDGVFLADTRSPNRTDVYLARRGRVVINTERQTVEFVLQNAVRHSSDNADSLKYDVLKFDQSLITLDPRTVFPTEGPSKGDREMSIAELEARAAERRERGESDRTQLIEIHRKYAIPFGCLIFGMIGLALGATNRRDGTLAGFVLGLAVIFLYYALLEWGRSLGMAGLVPVWTAAWLPNLVLGAMGILLFTQRRRVADQTLVPAFVRRWTSRRERTVKLWRLPVSILDRYVVATYVRILVLSTVALATIFYVSTFVDQAEKAYRGTISWGLLFSFMGYMTPQYVYYIIPLSILIATLTTVALMTKNSELIVMRACGISLYRTMMPLIIPAIVAGGALFALEQTILGPANRRAEMTKEVMEGGNADSLDISTRRWVLGNDGDIYNFNFYDQARRAFTRLTIYEFTPSMDLMVRRSFAATAQSVSDSEFDRSWRLENGWSREFNDEPVPPYTPFETTTRPLEPVAHFASAAPYPEFMSYTELRAYTERLDAGGGDVISQRAALARKVSFPFVTLVMALIAVPFAVTIGRSGAMAGIGVAIVVAIAYWVVSSIFTALGAGGAMPAQLAAWAPNVLFAAAATYLLLTVRT